MFKLSQRYIAVAGAIVLFILLHGQMLMAQGKDPVLMTVGGESVTKSEFLNIYLKNNSQGAVIDRKNLEEYLELFIKFKLKVKEAGSLGMDTTEVFRNELAGYRRDLAKPYLSDKTTIDALVKEAYERSKHDIRARHILIIIERDAAPEDTLKAWSRMMEIRNKYLAGESFTSLAEQFSEDPSARPSRNRAGQATVPGNAGDLGYFTALDMVYPFETGAYSTALGQVSMPVRSDFGYHLIQVTDIKPAIGQAMIAHIHVSVMPGVDPADSLQARKRIDEIYGKILAGMPFEEAAALYSDDKSSANKNGVLPEFGANRMVPEVIEVISTMKDTGTISPPIRTSYGWHIIKLLRKDGVADFKTVENQLRTKVMRDGRAAIGRANTAKSVQKEYGFKEYPKSLQAFKGIVDSTILSSTWTMPEGKPLNQKMFKIGKSVVTQADFAEYIIQNQRRYRAKHINGFIDLLYGQFVEQKSIDYLDKHLEAKYPDFRMLVKEYHDGILLFNLMDEKVWSRAVRDTIGLKAFFEQNAAKYQWEARADASIFRCHDASVAASVRSMLEAGDSVTQILSVINKENPLNLSVDNATYEKGDNKYLDAVPWTIGLAPEARENGTVVLVQIHRLIPASQKTLKEARGLVTADYQEYLERTWIEELRAKYPVIVNKSVFDSIK
jgi:peptidyl-prolyl cis-trans isomerase SurA